MNTKKPKNTTVLWLKICLQPNCYGKTTNKIKRFCVRLVWQGQKDLNPRHAVLETAALPTELYPYINFNRWNYKSRFCKLTHKFQRKIDYITVQSICQHIFVKFDILSRVVIYSAKYSVWLFAEIFSYNKVVNWNIEIIGQFYEHFEVWATQTVFVIRDSLTAYAQIHSDFKLAVSLFLSYGMKSDHFHQNINPCLHLVIDTIVTICYNIYVTDCYII